MMTGLDPALDTADTINRRTLLSRLIAVCLTGIGSLLAVITGSAVVSSSFAAQREDWVPTARLDELQEGVPTPITLRVIRRSGYLQEVDRQLVFLVKRSDEQVTALSSTCTHLGCRVSWNPELGVIACPCHGGVYNTRGEVQAGPPPRPLPSLSTRVDEGRVFIQV